MAIYKINCNDCRHIFYDIEVACGALDGCKCIHCQSEKVSKSVVEDKDMRHKENRCSHGEEYLKKVRDGGGCHNCKK